MKVIYFGNKDMLNNYLNLSKDITIIDPLEYKKTIIQVIYKKRPELFVIFCDSFGESIDRLRNLLETIKIYSHGKIIMISSSRVYEASSKEVCCETDNMTDNNSYDGFYYTSCEKLLKMYFSNYLILRPSNILGSFSNCSYIKHSVLELYRLRKINYLYEKDKIFLLNNYISYNDLFKVIDLSLEFLNKHEEVCEIINIGNKNIVDLKTINKMLVDITKINGEINVCKCDEKSMSTNKMKELLGIELTTDIKKILIETVNDYKKQYGFLECILNEELKNKIENASQNKLMQMKDFYFRGYYSNKKILILIYNRLMKFKLSTEDKKKIKSYSIRKLYSLLKYCNNKSFVIDSSDLLDQKCNEYNTYYNNLIKEYAEKLLKTKANKKTS